MSGFKIFRSYFQRVKAANAYIIVFFTSMFLILYDPCLDTLVQPKLPSLVLNHHVVAKQHKLGYLSYCLL